MTRPIHPLGLDHVVLRCVRLEETLAFYRDVLGCPVERVVEDLGLHQLRAGLSLLDLVPVGSTLGGDTPPDPDGFNVAHFCLRVADPDWDAIRAWLADHGAECEEPARRYGADGHGLSVYLTDPEGNTVELKGPPRPQEA